MKTLRYSALAVLVLLAAVYASDEISVTSILKVDNGNFTLERRVQNYLVDQTGTAADYGIKACSPSATNAITISNVTVPRYAFFRNLNTGSNSIVLTCTILLRANDIAVIPLRTTTMTAFSTNGAANLEYWVNQE